MLTFSLQQTLFWLLVILCIVVSATIAGRQWISRRKQIDNFLSAVRPLLDQTTLGIIVHAHNQDIVYANPAAQRILRFDLSASNQENEEAIQSVLAKLIAHGDSGQWRSDGMDPHPCSG